MKKIKNTKTVLKSVYVVTLHCSQTKNRLSMALVIQKRR